MRIWVRTGIALSFVAAVLFGCHGGGKKDVGSASTVAPTVSGTQTGPAPVGSGTTGTGIGGVTTSTLPSVPVAPTGNDTYVASFLLNEVQVVDDTNLTVKTRFQVGRGPTSVAVNGSWAYVTNSLDQNIAVVDRLTNTVNGTIDVAAVRLTGISMIDSLVQPLRRPTGIAVTPNGLKAYTANLVDVTSVDLVARKPLKSIFSWNLNFSGGIGAGLTSFLSAPLAAAGPTRVAATNTHAFVTNIITNNVTMISATDDKVMFNTKVGRLPYGVACANGKVYVACAMTNEIWILDETTGAVRSSFKAGLMPMDVAASPSGDKVYVTNLAGGDVTIIDTSIDIPVGVLPAGLPLASILQQMGIPVPPGGATGLSGALSAFLSAFTGAGAAGSGGSTLGGLMAALMGGGSTAGAGPGGLLNPQALINAIMSGFLAYMGMNSSTLANLSLPGLGIASISVNASGKRVICANWFMGQITVTDTTTLQVNGLMPGSTGMGPASVAAAR